MTHPEYLTVAEVAARVRVSKMTVYRLVHTGELAGIRVGRSFRIPATIVDAYLERTNPIDEVFVTTFLGMGVIRAAIELDDANTIEDIERAGEVLAEIVRQYREEQAAIAETNAILADPDTMAAIAEAEAELS